MSPWWLPVVAAQGLWVRRHTEVLPEAAGPLTGTVERSEGDPIRLLVVGESTAAGCGASTHEEAFTGSFARALAARHRRPVRWQVRGLNGATVRRVRHRMLPEIDVDSDIAVLLIGVNDVLTRTPTEQWRHDLTAVLDLLTSRADRVVVAGIPPFDAFPSLPGTLRRYLAERGRSLDDIAREASASRASVSWIGSRDLVPAEPDHFARDGFHPSPAGYQRWAQELCNRAFR